MASKQKPYRIIQWATGAVGKYAIKAVAENPDLQLVGCYVFSAAKAGMDAGEIAGIGKLGVTASNDIDAVLGMDADCVVYTPLLSNVDEICRILESGKSVVTSTGFVYLKDQQLLDRINQACRSGGVSFHGSGIHPGFGGDRLPLICSALCNRIDKVTVYEIANLFDMSESPEMVKSLGFGMSAEQARRQPPMLLGVMSTIFRESMHMIAAGIGCEIDEFATNHEFALATGAIHTASGVIEKGHVAGQHFEYKAFVKGKLAIHFQTYWSMGPQQEPSWPHYADLKYIVEIEGEPGLRCEFAPVGARPAELGLIFTTMNVVNAIPLICAAEPGIHTALDLPMITARHAYRGAHS